MKAIARIFAKTAKAQLLRALILSVISLFACIAMFTGTTYAWMTDSVTSGRNRIVAGALDVNMYYSENLADWQDVSDHAGDNLFTTEYWEPGVAEVLYLKVENAGTQTLTYDFFVSAGDLKVGQSAEDGSEIYLSQLLRYGIIPMDTQEPFAQAEVAVAALGDAGRTLNRFFRTGDNALSAAQTQVYALVVYLPEDETTANANPLPTAVPRVELGISLRAKQSAGDGDSFDDTYDGTAGYDNQYTVLLDTDQDGKTTAEAKTYDGAARLTVPVGVKVNTYEDGKGSMTLKLAKITPTAEIAEGEAVEAYRVSALGAADDNEVPMVLTMELAPEEGTTVLYVYKNDELFNAWSFDAATNCITFTDTDFDTLQVVTGHITAANLNTLLAMRSEWTLTDDVTMAVNTPLVLPEGTLLHLGGHTLTLNVKTEAEEDVHSAIDVQGNAAMDGGKLIINATVTEPGVKANLTAATVASGKKLNLSQMTLNNTLEFGSGVVKSAVVYE